MHLFRSVYKQCRCNDQYVYILRTLPIEIAKDVACISFSDLQLSDIYEKNDDYTLEMIDSFMPVHLEEIIEAGYYQIFHQLMMMTRKQFLHDKARLQLFLSLVQ